VYLPCGSTHMGKSPGAHAADTGITPLIGAGETVVAGTREAALVVCEPSQGPSM
jgi:hypothetical protein